MRIEQLKYLIAISNSPSINVASEKLHISYQALSHSVKALESELNLTLLRRTNKGSQLTEDGYRVVSLAKQFIKGIEALQTTRKEEETQISGTVTFLTMDICLEGFLYDLMDYLKKSYPGINCKYQILSSRKQIIDTLREHSSTCFAITFQGLELYDNTFPDDIRIYDLLKSEIKILCSPSHEIAQYPSVTLKQLEPYQLLLRRDSQEAIADDWLSFSNTCFESNPLLFEREILYGNSVSFAFHVPFAPYWIPAIDNAVKVPLRTNNDIYLSLLCHNDFKANAAEKIFLNVLFSKLSINQTI